MAYSYKGSLSFGLVYIPITLHSATRSNDISFNLLDKKTMSRVQYIKTCVDCEGAPVETNNIIKGYRYDEDKYVTFEAEDFEKLKSKKDKNITIEQFVDLQEIDPIYFNKSYYVVPSGAERAFVLFKKALFNKNKVGLAKTVLGTKETLIAIRVLNDELVLSTMHFYNEIQENPIKEMSNIVIDEAELGLADLIIANMSAPFDPAKYHDEYKEKIQGAIEAKIAGQEFSTPVESATTSIAGLMEALTASIEATNKKGAKKQKVKTASSTKKATPKKKAPTKNTLDKIRVPDDTDKPAHNI